MSRISVTDSWPPYGGSPYRHLTETPPPSPLRMDREQLRDVTTTSSAVPDDLRGGGSWNLEDKSFGQRLWIFGGPVIFATGLIGNILVLAVMARRRMQGTSTSFYLRIMALADMLVLVTGMIPEWLEHTDIVVFKQLHPATCKLEKFSFYTCADTAVWILMVFTVDRFIAVCFPLSKKDYCLTSRARLYALAAFLCAVTKNFHVFWTRGAEYYLQGNESWSGSGADGRKDNGTDSALILRSNCGRPEPYTNFEMFIRPWIAISLVSFIPFTVILVCNVFIIRALLAVRRLHHEQSIASQSDRTLIQMTIMCLSASFAFLICIAPSIVLLIGRPYWQTASWYDVVKDVNNQLVYINHSINFFLYCLTGRRFRHELMRMCCECAIYRKCVSARTGAGGSPISSLAETTVYRVDNTRPWGASPSGRKKVSTRLQYPPKNGVRQGSAFGKMSSQRTNAYRPIEGVSVAYRKADTPCMDGKHPEYESVL